MYFSRQNSVTFITENVGCKLISRPLLPSSYSNGLLSLLSVYWLFSPLVNRPHGPGRQLAASEQGIELIMVCVQFRTIHVAI